MQFPDAKCPCRCCGWTLVADHSLLITWNSPIQFPVLTIETKFFTLVCVAPITAVCLIMMGKNVQTSKKYQVCKEKPSLYLCGPAFSSFYELPDKILWLNF